MRKPACRICFETDKDLYEKSTKIPWGIRSALLRVLLEKIVESGEEHGSMIYGAILDGEFDLVQRTKS